MNRRSFVSSTLATISAATLGLFASRATAKEAVSSAAPTPVAKPRYVHPNERAGFVIYTASIAVPNNGLGTPEVDEALSRPNLHIHYGSPEEMVYRSATDVAWVCAYMEHPTDHAKQYARVLELLRGFPSPYATA